MSACPHTDDTEVCTCGPGCGCEGYPIEPGQPNESYAFTDADFRDRVMAGKPAPTTPEFARKLTDRFVDAEPTVPEFVNELVRRQADADFALRESQSRAAIVAKVCEALWTDLERQAEEPMGPYVDREMGMVDASGASLNMGTLAAAAVDVFIELLRNPPTRVTHADGHVEIRWPEEEAGGSKQ